MRMRLLSILAGAAAVAAAPLAAAAAAQSDRAVVVIASHDAPPYLQASTGIQRIVAPHRQGRTLQGASLEMSERAVDEAVRNAGPDAILVALGANALEYLRAKGENQSMIACMVLDSGDLAGVTLRPLAQTRLERMHAVLPDVKVVGLLYGARQDRPYVERFIRIGEKMGFQFIARMAGDENDPRQIAPWSANAIDAIITMYDTRLNSPRIVQHLLQYSLRNRIPLIGLSDAWTKAGALLSLDWDFADLGEQCGLIVLDVLRGADPANLGVAGPRKVIYSINLRTANYLRLTIPTEQLKNARHIFE